jgi:hypothetical protein
MKCGFDTNVTNVDEGGDSEKNVVSSAPSIFVNILLEQLVTCLKCQNTFMCENVTQHACSQLEPNMVDACTNTEEAVLTCNDNAQDTKVQKALQTWLPAITSKEGIITIHTTGKVGTLQNTLTVIFPYLNILLHWKLYTIVTSKYYSYLVKHVLKSPGLERPHFVIPLVYIICTTCLKRLLFNFYLSWVVSSIQV